MGLDSFRIGKVVLGSMFKKPATLMYPVIARQWQERTRGSIKIEEESCILCGICARKCPTNAIAVSRDQRTWAIERMRCVQCGSCVETCPKKCLFMLPEYTAPNAEKIVDCFDVPEQAKPEAPKAEAPKPEAPKAEEIKAEEPKAEEIIVEEPKAEEAQPES